MTMKLTHLRIITSFFLIIFLYSCDRNACKSDNPIFVENDVRSKVYQNEVADQIEMIGIENLRFWLGNYFENKDQPYFILYVQNDDLCAKAVVSINTENPKLKKLLETKGRGRFNAEFTDVNLEIESHPNGDKTLEWRSYATIID